MKNALVTLIIGYCLVFFAACSDKKKSSQEPAPRPVRYGVITLVGGNQLKTFSGTTRSASETNLSFRSSGIVQTLKVKVGESVARGKVLATIDNRDALLNYDKTQATLQSAETQKNTALSSLKRIKKLFKNNNVALADYEKAKSSYASAVSNYETTLKTLRLQERQLNYTKLIAPQAGIITRVTISSGEFVQAGSPAIILNSGKEMEISVGIPERYISLIKENDNVSLNFSAIKEQSFYASVSEVSFSKETQAGVYPVVIKVIEPVSEIRPGMSASVQFNFQDKTNSDMILAPLASIGSDPQGSFTFMLVPSENPEVYSVKKTAVTTGKLSSDGFEILSGVSDGDIVATAGLKSLYDGMNVKLLKK